MAVDKVIECIWMDLVPEYCQSSDSGTVYTAPPIVVRSVHGSSNRHVPRLALHMRAEDVIPTFITSIIDIGICFPKALTLTWPRSYTMFKVLGIVRINASVGLRAILKFRLLWDACPYWLARGIPLKERVPYPLQSNVRTPPPPIRWTFLVGQISLNGWLPSSPLHSDCQ